MKRSDTHISVLFNTEKCSGLMCYSKKHKIEAPTQPHNEYTTLPLKCTQVREFCRSDYMIAAILSIEFPAGEIHPVAFHSWTLHAAELNYDTHNKELLSIFEAFTVWRHYLEGSA